MGHVFIAYARDKVKEMKAIRSRFKDCGLTAWTDENIKRSDKDWKRTIEREIDSSVALVALLSPSAKNSFWVRTEIEYARAQEKGVFLLIVEGNKKTAVPFPEIGAILTSLVGLDDKQREIKILSIIEEIKS